MSNDLVPSPLDEPSKAVQEASKLGTSIVGAAEKSGSYFATVVGSLPGDLVGIYADRVRQKRWVQFQKLQREREALLRAWGVDSPGEPTPAIETAVLASALDEDRSNLFDLWARLLAAASIPSRRDRVRKSYIELLKQFDPYDALMFRWISQSIRSDLAIPLDAVKEMSAKSELNIPSVEAEISFNRLRADLGLIGERRATIKYKEHQNYNTNIATLTPIGSALSEILLDKP